MPLETKSQYPPSPQDVGHDASPVVVLEGSMNELRSSENLNLQRLGETDMSSLRNEGQATIAWSVVDNPDHPYNWPKLRIYTNAGILTFLAFLNPLSSCQYTTGLSEALLAV